MTKPQLFISHKHTSPDKEIASVLAQFVKERSNNDVEVFVSSDPKFGGPEVGGGLTEQLRDALSTAGVVLLVYTEADQDWSYCMWECGVATDPKTAATNVKVIQCGTEAPKPFANDLRVNARDAASVESFVRSFMTSENFFPDTGPITGFEKTDRTIETVAKELFEKLQLVLPLLAIKEPVRRSTWPFVSIELAQDQVERLKGAAAQERDVVSRDILSASVIVDQDQAEGIFGIQFEHRQCVSEVFKAWSERNPTANADWFSALAEQILDSARRLNEPSIRWSPLQRKDGTKFLSVVAATRTEPETGAMLFDVYFFIAEPEAVVSERMIPSAQIKSRPLDATDVTIADFLEEFDNLTRMPFFGTQGEPRYIVHRSMVDRFAAQAAREGSDVRNLKVTDLLSDPAMQAMFESTFVVVPPDATLDEARREMNARINCQDVFVTENGSPQGAVLGWITNTMIV